MNENDVLFQKVTQAYSEKNPSAPIQWRILQKRFDSAISFAIKTTVACAVLHNICIRIGDEWEEEESDDDCDPGRPKIFPLNHGIQISDSIHLYS